MKKKRQAMLLIAVLLSLTCVTAFAAGLGGLSGLSGLGGSGASGGLGGLNGSGASGGLGGLSASGALPNPEDVLGVNAVLYQEDLDIGGVSYMAYALPMPGDFDAFLAAYTKSAQQSGYAVSKTTALSQSAYQIKALHAAYMIPNYRGCLLFVVHPNMQCALLPTPSPTPRPTATPAPAAEKPKPAIMPQSGGGSGGHYETVQVKQDCFACANGKCSLCHGSGWYRLYGEKVPCSIYCETCNGLGYWYQTQMIWVP